VLRISDGGRARFLLFPINTLSMSYEASSRIARDKSRSKTRFITDYVSTCCVCCSSRTQLLLLLLVALVVACFRRSSKTKQRNRKLK
jgi:hypothetical protein